MDPICRVYGPRRQPTVKPEPDSHYASLTSSVYNLVRMAMWHSAIFQHIAVERISFLDALRWLGATSTGMPLIALIVNPARPYRVEPRVKKRRSKSFPLMMKPRQALRRQWVQ
jgi:hypothetical protein